MEQSVVLERQFDGASPNYISTLLNENLLIEDVDYLQVGQPEREFHFYDWSMGMPEPSVWQQYPHNYKFTGFDVQFNQDLTQIERKTYDFLEFLGDLGGLLDALYGIGLLVVSPFVDFETSNQIMSQLFMFKSSKPATDKNVDAAVNATSGR